MGTAKTMLTFEEFEQLPDQPGKRELLKGELIELPAADFSHNETAHRIRDLLKAALDAAHTRGEAADLGSAYVEMGYRLTADAYVQPDVSVTHAGQAVAQYLGGAPAIAIEVISPSNTVEEMELKTKLYFQFGAREVWRVHPRTRCMVVHLPGRAHEVAEEETLTTPLLPGMALAVREILL
ncbi:MAG TPA: Uma2 family endonuclease [Candidatus Sulfopaludibacter sp.]|nr:Uma2 family endonuclease [Candidatus Sulfopaludibacter sp.]